MASILYAAMKASQAGIGGENTFSMIENYTYTLSYR